MANRELAVGLVFLTQTTVGILGNFSLLCHYVLLSFTDYRLKSTDFIHKHLTVGNFLSLLCRGVPQTMAAFGWKHILSHFGCKLLFFLHRVGRGVSIGSICIVSVYQAITISPRNSWWAELKVKAPKYVVPSIILCWMLQMLVNVIFPLYLTSTSSEKNITNKKDFGYCSSVRHDKTSASLYAALLSFPDVLCLGLMLWASSTMVLILYRHKKRVQHIRRTISSRSSPESRATKTILLLLSTFVYFYTLSSVFQVVLSLSDNPSGVLLNITAIMAMCFPTVSPYLLMSRDPKVPRLCFAWAGNIKSPHLMRNM
ncbi:vomeronasal type-1 receptor 4-like [Zalophus californianus]|uniref:Vomeronasal type-1 receptor n=1 Tax=Zalophus californianus TaxID=9704 RepID=A0A6J2F162_ZALCA|nr:vomeronasal type-1 receptor 4-like [Zalophus californianus]XP_027951386.1 LOW QUALITY PROTEIN: vomeronasal type-1 receptor 4-like [Eumetopias jubatus]